MGDLNGKRGRIQGSASVGGGEVEIVATVPTSEILRYAIDLRSMTGGRGRFTATPLALRPGALAPRRQDRHAAGDRGTLRSSRQTDAATSLRGSARCTPEHVAVDRVELARGRGYSAVRRRCRAGCATSGGCAAPPRELRRRVADREADRAARDRERLGLVDAQRPRGEEVVDRDDAEQAARRAGSRRCRWRDPPARQSTADDGVDRPGDAAPLDVGERVRPDVRGDVEIVGQRVALVSSSSGPSSGHGRRRYRRASACAVCRSSSLQGLGQHPGLGDRRHEVGVARPAGQRVHVEVIRDPGAGGRPEVRAEVDAVGLVRRADRAHRAPLREGERGRLVVAEIFELPTCRTGATIRWPEPYG